jgi:hypothetical protein
MSTSTPAVLHGRRIVVLGASRYSTETTAAPTSAYSMAGDGVLPAMSPRNMPPP